MDVSAFVSLRAAAHISSEDSRRDGASDSLRADRSGASPPTTCGSELRYPDYVELRLGASGE